MLTLPPDTDVDFPLTITAVSKETSNGDEESSDARQSISSTNSTSPPPASNSPRTTRASGAPAMQFTFVDDRFVGINTGEFDETVGGALFAGVSGHIQLGFQSTLTFEGGEIDATVGLRRHGRDQLQQDHRPAPDRHRRPADRRQFQHHRPDRLLCAGFHLRHPAQRLRRRRHRPRAARQHQRVRSTSEIDIGPGSFNVLDLDSDTLAGTIEFPPPLDAFSVNFAWPNITTNGDFPPNPVTGDGASNNFLELDLDVDTLVTQLVGIPNVFDPPRLTVGPVLRRHRPARRRRHRRAELPSGLRA